MLSSGFGKKKIETRGWKELPCVNPGGDNVGSRFWVYFMLETVNTGNRGCLTEGSGDREC